SDLIDQLSPAAQLLGPRPQRGGRHGMVAVVDKFVRYAVRRQPFAGLDAGAALGQAIQGCLVLHFNSDALRNCRRLTRMTQMPTPRMNRVASALTSGLSPRRTREKTSMSSVVEPGPDRNEATTTSSSDSVNDSSHADASAGAISGSVMRKNTVSGVAPRSSAASSSERSRSRTRAWIMTATKAMHSVTWPTQMVNMPFSAGQPNRPRSSTNMSSREIPNTTSGMTSGALSMPRYSVNPRNRPMRTST